MKAPPLGEALESLMHRSWSCLVLALLLASSSPAFAGDEDPIVAFPKVTGPKPASRGGVAKGAKAALERAGITVIRGAALKEAADGGDVYQPEVAEAAGAHYLLVIKLSRKGGRFMADARLLRAGSGEEVAVAKRKYRSRKTAKKTGAKLGTELAKAAFANMAEPEPEPAPVAQRPVAKPAAPAAAPTPSPVASEPEPEPVPAAPSRPEPKDEDPGVVAEAPEPSGEDDGEDVFRLSLRAGSKAYSAYSVVVDGQVTGLSYTLTPLLSFGAGAEFKVPGTGLGLAANFGFSPVKFSVDVEPAVDVTEPGGQFIDAGGQLFYQLKLASIGSEGSFWLRPEVGADYAVLLVEEQGVNTIVTSWSTFAVTGGLRFGLDLSKSLELDAFGRFGYLLGFSEGPVSSGTNGSGIGLSFGAAGRYFVTDSLGAFVSVAYRYQSVSTEGAGDRVSFVNDPDLMNAEVLTGDLDLGVGLVLAF